MVGSPELWVALSFVAFMAIVVYLGVPRLVTKSLDDRAAGIKKELEEARKLREEAATLLADYKKRREEATKEAEAIVAQAKAEASALAAETKAGLKEMLERRSRLAEEKIARAEAEAQGEVRAAAIEAAIGAAEQIMAGKLNGSADAALISRSIKELKGKLG